MEALDLFVKDLKKRYGEKVKKIILFGSAARGEFKEGSDIDVLIVVDGDSFKMQKEISDIVLDVLLKTGIYISAKVLSSEEYSLLEKMKSAFYRNLVKEGIVVG